jgi:hypothetical protein
MKQETNKEMDLLLRRLSRRQDASMPDAKHLDADELSSYAENALPAVARSRYTEHLAECSKCRELVVQLSSSVGFVGTEEITRASERSGLWKFLASIFSPLVVRFAVPAVGLIIVAAIGFAVYRNNRQDVDLVAQRGATPAAEAPPRTVFQVENQEKPGATATTPESRTETERSKQTEAAPAPVAPPSVSDTTAANREEPLQKEQQQAAGSTGNSEPSQPVSTPAATIDEVRKVEALAPQGRTADAKEAPRERADESKKDEGRRSEDVATARPSSAKTATDSRAARGGGIANLQIDGLGDKDDAETRAVAGRRFRKQGGIWIDTAYNSQSAVVNLNRGSEQYRALVADEPAIRTIAEQLDGQIVVVWKGRTYRIR